MSNALGMLQFNERLGDFLEDYIEQYRYAITPSAYFQSLAQVIRSKEGIEASLGAPLAEIYEDMHHRIEHGGTFADAIRGHVPAYCQMIIEAAQSIGKLDEGLVTALRAYQSLQKMKAIIYQHCAMPLILLIAGLGLAWLFGNQIVPQFMSVVKFDSMGLFLKGTYHFAQFGKSYAMLIIPLVLMALAGTFYSLRHLHGPLRDIADRFPPWSIYKQYSASYLLIVMSGLVRGNVKPGDAFSTLAAAGSPFERYHLEQMLDAINAGQEPAHAMATGLFSQRIIERLQMYQRNHRFEEILGELGGSQIDKALRNVEKDIKRATAIFKIMFGVFLVGVILNTFAIQDAIRASMH